MPREDLFEGGIRGDWRKKRDEGFQVGRGGGSWEGLKKLQAFGRREEVRGGMKGWVVYWGSGGGGGFKGRREGKNVQRGGDSFTIQGKNLEGGLRKMKLKQYD